MKEVKSVKVEVNDSTRMADIFAGVESELETSVYQHTIGVHDMMDSTYQTYALIIVRGGASKLSTLLFAKVMKEAKVVLASRTTMGYEVRNKDTSFFSRVESSNLQEVEGNLGSISVILTIDLNLEVTPSGEVVVRVGRFFPSKSSAQNVYREVVKRRNEEVARLESKEKVATALSEYNNLTSEEKKELLNKYLSQEDINL